MQTRHDAPQASHANRTVCRCCLSSKQAAMGAAPRTLAARRDSHSVHSPPPQRRTKRILLVHYLRLSQKQKEEWGHVSNAASSGSKHNTQRQRLARRKPKVSRKDLPSKKEAQKKT
ncbi:hypothetical protein TraAM80_08785 [Trypanosoma rangeli]|uniref:Uncharacterized protein n=1 Tax=Trypanosoma rangeli TaxID=5698 RepID=A0A3R7KDL9_TRYRA|nr:uncharacterized protein TraAM80_08785 [Trypanosoma rangeli]RNE98406.1 hypothetical protein TraAM80_08785 [Trypanosoma rangeli]|eukprot:RNE98406.1 hypothetical protein TraAM80_08785 [Trypanosoma rangeli]